MAVAAAVAAAAAVMVAAVLVQSCSKGGGAAAIGSGVYVTGDDGVDPILWNGGHAHKLVTNGGFGAQVLLAGSDVYVAGFSNEGTQPVINFAGPSGQFTYWKNGAETIVTPMELLTVQSIAMTVNGTDIYFSDGQVYENGSVIPVQGVTAEGAVCSAMTVGGNVYFAGRDSAGNGAYWKNGVLHEIALTQPLGGGILISCLYVSDTDVYVGGTDVQSNAAIWKNGVKTILQSSDGQPLYNVRSIFVQGQDVYWISNGPDDPAYWKNGVVVKLPLNGASSGGANSIFVSGNDVYVAGATSNGAVLWKNGVATVLSPGGQANSVVVQ